MQLDAICTFVFVTDDDGDPDDEDEWLVMTLMMSMMVGDDHHGSGPVGSVGLPLCQRPVRNTRQAKRKIRW